MKILFGVFDWGLGHATRDMPLIEALLKKKHEVHILATGRALALLQKRFGKQCTYFDVPSLGSPYTSTRFFTLNFVIHVPVMLRNLQRARAKTEVIIRNGKYDRVISDCRYDVYDKVENSYLINHQLRFQSFAGAEHIAEAWLAHQQRKYRYVIVPDFEHNNLSGRLSHDLRSLESSRIRYIGILSQVHKRTCKKDIDYFISISGPEPQRTVLEEKILQQAPQLHGRIVIALGKPELHTQERRGNITIYSFLDHKAQEHMMNHAKCIVTRSGYTTMMELYELGIQHALLIPTPGQTEQEYLADLYDERREFHHISQYELNLAKDIADTKEYAGFRPQWNTSASVRKFLKILQL